MFEPWAKWTVDVMILAGKAVLSVVIHWIELVAPFSRKVKPLSGSIGCSIGSAQCIRNIVIRVSERVKSRIPKRAAICFIVEDSEREDIWVCTGRCVHCVGAHCRIDNGLFHVSGRSESETFRYLLCSRSSPRQSSYTLTQKNVH